jgi:hypothetical protein
LDNVEHDTLLWSSTFPLVPLLVLDPVPDGHAAGDAQAERLEGDVHGCTLCVSGSFSGGEEEGGSDGETLTDGVEHAERNGSLGLRTRVV